MFPITNGTLTALIAPRGATLAGLWHRDVPHSLVLGSNKAEDYASSLPYFGAVVGPIANRVSGASVVIDGKTWPLPSNEGTNCLHGGPVGTHARAWTLIRQTQTRIDLVLDLPHGACGLPGKRSLSARYEFAEGGLRLTLEARADRNTLMNLAHHPYWSLDGLSDVGSHSIRVAADHYLPLHATKIPTGDVAPVEGTAYDFRGHQKIAADTVLDTNLCLADARRDHPEFAAELVGASGVSLRIDTTEPGLQIYNGADLIAVHASLHDARQLVPFAAVALEPQGWPDAPNHPHFPSIELAKGTLYRQITRYSISA